MSYLTVRNVPAELSDALVREKARRGLSLNATVIALLAGALGVERPLSGRNDLARLAGTWTDEEAAEFEKAMEVFDVIDEDMWR